MDQADNEVRVWSAGCATGEEPYSIAILMHQNAVASNAPESFERISILGTDIDSLSLEHAARARYQDTALVDTPVDLRERYFREDSGFISPVPEARRPVTFESSDLLAFKAPLERAHLIVCRNVVIYFERGAQDALFAHFHEILEPGGYLVLGKVETLLGEARNMFTPVNARERIFRKV
jgi:chemotaxis methyl-accepting protein methylase